MNLDDLTIQATPGLAYVSSPLLVAATVIVAHRSGQALDPVDTDPVGRQSKHDATAGRVYIDADNPFGDDETVQVIYSPGSGVVDTPPIEIPDNPFPLPCLGPNSVTAYLNGDNTITVQMPDMADYRVSIIDAAGVCGVATPVASGTTSLSDTYTSPVLSPGSYKACVYKDCSVNVSSSSTSNTVIVPAPGNFTVKKVPPEPSVKITGVSGISYSIISGAFPLQFGNQLLTGNHGAYTGVISVQLSLPAFRTVVVGLYRNAPQIEYKTASRSTPGTATINFSSFVFAAGDIITIILDYT